ncbi:MAG TPA: hypothetical protein VFE51_14060 [Verrucomicrobiae bacterium]|nr:hypothetical protein [Verrucomicrobiae bacterium]
MNAKVRIFGIVGGLALLGVIFIFFEGRPRPTPLINGERLANAVARYTKDLHGRGEALPRTVTLDTLVGQGYLSAEDTKPLQGVELVFHTDGRMNRNENSIKAVRILEPGDLATAPGASRW